MFLIPPLRKQVEEDRWGICKIKWEMEDMVSSSQMISSMTEKKMTMRMKRCLTTEIMLSLKLNSSEVTKSKTFFMSTPACKPFGLSLVGKE